MSSHLRRQWNMTLILQMVRQILRDRSPMRTKVDQGFRHTRLERTTCVEIHIESGKDRRGHGDSALGESTKGL